MKQDHVPEGIKPRHESKERHIAESDFYPLVNTQLQSRYDRIATKWNGTAYENTRRDDLLPVLIQNADLADGQRILEAMSGPARLAENVKKSFPNSHIVALDFSMGMLNEASNELEKVCASVLGMPFDKSTFDRILLRTAIYDLPRRLQRNALAEVCRVLKLQGVFVLQTYISESKTQKTLNDIANLKDRLAGQYQDMGDEPPRYFATKQEFSEWFSDVGLVAQEVLTFESAIQLQKASEMSETAKAQWTGYLDALDAGTKADIGLAVEASGSHTYKLPGVVYKLTRAF